MSEDPTSLPVRPRVVIADNHPAVLRELRALLEPEFDVVGTVSDGCALVAMVEALRPDVVVSDVVLRILDGVGAAQQIGRHHPGVKVVFVTVLTEPEVRQHAFAAGAAAFLSKASAGDELIPAVRAVTDNPLDHKTKRGTE